MHPQLPQIWLRLRYAARAGAGAVRAAAAAMLAPIGFRETLLLGGATLIGVALAPISPPFALGIPGAIFIYVAIFGVN
jgi:hypothetical protein